MFSSVSLAENVTLSLHVLLLYSALVLSRLSGFLSHCQNICIWLTPIYDCSSIASTLSVGKEIIINTTTCQTKESPEEIHRIIQKGFI